MSVVLVVNSYQAVRMYLSVSRLSYRTEQVNPNGEKEIIFGTQQGSFKFTTDSSSAAGGAPIYSIKSVSRFMLVVGRYIPLKSSNPQADFDAFDAAWESAKKWADTTAAVGGPGPVPAISDAPAAKQFSYTFTLQAGGRRRATRKSRRRRTTRRRR